MDGQKRGEPDSAFHYGGEHRIHQYRQEGQLGWQPGQHGGHDGQHTRTPCRHAAGRQGRPAVLSKASPVTYGLDYGICRIRQSGKSTRCRYGVRRLRFTSRTKIRTTRNDRDMNNYDFIKIGNKVFWHDPDGGLSDGVYQVVDVPEEIEEDSIILIASDYSEAEVFAAELSPL